MQITTNGLGFLIGDFLLPYYGLMISIGAVVAGILGYLFVRRHKKSGDIFIILVTSGVIGGFAGAKLLYILTHWEETFASGISLQDGFVFYGGILGAFVVLFLIHRFTPIDVIPYVQICSACVPIAHGFGRVGCHLVGCCYGKEFAGLGVFPVQMTEAIGLWILGIVLIIYVWRNACPTYTLQLYLVTYATLRFILEYFRGDAAERGIYGPFSTSQWISIGLVLGVFLYYVAKRHKKQSAL